MGSTDRIFGQSPGKNIYNIFSSSWLNTLNINHQKSSKVTTSCTNHVRFRNIRFHISVSNFLIFCCCWFDEILKITFPIEKYYLKHFFLLTTVIALTWNFFVLFIHHIKNYPLEWTYYNIICPQELNIIYIHLPMSLYAII